MTPTEYNARLAEAWQYLLMKDGKLTPSAEVVIADLAETTGFTTPLPGNDPYTLALAEGMRRTFLRIFGALKLDPHKLRSTREIHGDD